MAHIVPLTGSNQSAPPDTSSSCVMMLARSSAAKSVLNSFTARGVAGRFSSGGAETPGVPKSTAENFGTVDNHFTEDRLEKKEGDPSRRAFTYFMLGGTRMMWSSAARALAIGFVSAIGPADDVLALGSAEFDLAAIKPGSTITVKWRGKPVFIRHRTAEEVAEAESAPLDGMVDAQKDSDRCIKPNWLVVIGVCTHLGCVPLSNAGEYNGWFCPCHGSHYDLSARIRKGPAPLNLEVPPYKFIEENKILVG